MKRCSAPLVIRKMQIKTSMRYFTPTRMGKIENTDCIGSDLEQLKVSYPSGENVKYYNHFGKQFES